jgi:mitochondrial fission protein ELM1
MMEYLRRRFGCFASNSFACGEFFFASPKKEQKKATLGRAVFRDKAAKNFPARFALVGRRTNSLSRAIKRESSNSVRHLDRPRLQCSALHIGACERRFQV